MLICQYVCFCCRSGSIRADAFRGHGLSLLEKTTLWGLRTRAVPAGVTALHSPGLVKLYDVFILLLLPQSVVSKLKLAEEKHEDSCGSKCFRWDEQCTVPEASMRPRSASAR